MMEMVSKIATKATAKTTRTASSVSNLADTIHMMLSVAVPKIVSVMHYLLIVARRFVDCVYQPPVTRIEIAATREEAKTVRLQQKLDAARRLASVNNRLLKAINANTALRKQIDMENSIGWQNRRPK